MKKLTCFLAVLCLTVCLFAQNTPPSMATMTSFYNSIEDLSNQVVSDVTNLTPTTEEDAILQMIMDKDKYENFLLEFSKPNPDRTLIAGVYTSAGIYCLQASTKLAKEDLMTFILFTEFSKKFLDKSCETEPQSFAFLYLGYHVTLLYSKNRIGNGLKTYELAMQSFRQSFKLAYREYRAKKIKIDNLRMIYETANLKYSEWLLFGQLAKIFDK